VLEERENVLRVANNALRFRPADEALAARGQALAADGAGGGSAGERRRGPRGQGGGPGGEGGAQRGVEQLAQALELTPEQQATARQAFANARQSARGGGGGGDRRAMMRQVRESALREIEPTLNEHQRTLLAQMRQGGGPRAEVRRQAVVWVLRNNRPMPVQIEIGVADNGHTLVHSGLSEGDEVIIGGGPQARDNERGRSPFGGGRHGGARIRGA
jgi:HlyD family secretion protein